MGDKDDQRAVRRIFRRAERGAAHVWSEVEEREAYSAEADRPRGSPAATRRREGGRPDRRLRPGLKEVLQDVLFLTILVVSTLVYGRDGVWGPVLAILMIIAYFRLTTRSRALRLGPGWNMFLSLLMLSTVLFMAGLLLAFFL